MSGYKTALISSIKNEILDEKVESQSWEEASLTTPESDFLHMFFNECVKKKVSYVVMEVSSHSIAMKRVHGLSFDVVGFTNLAPEHMDFHKTMDHYFNTKTKIFNQVVEGGSIIINGDDDWGRRVERGENRCFFGKGLFSIERDKKSSGNNFNGLSIFLRGEKFFIPNLFGDFNAYNVAMSILACKKLKISTSDIKDALKFFPGIPGRLQMHKLKNGARAFVDYAHNPSSFESVLKALRGLANHLIVLFGCGGNRDKTKRNVMGCIAAHYGDVVIITSDNPRNEDKEKIIDEIYKGIPNLMRSKTFLISDRHDAIKKSVELSSEKSIIALLGKGHEMYYMCNGKKEFFSDFNEIVKY
jgi:UDP-N-acetylmuramoyl-L-alanyl-D-glutamate--2,6-diaminopimelate ligase